MPTPPHGTDERLPQPPDPDSGRPAGLLTLAEEHEALLAFLYAAPVGLVQTRLDGEVELINAVTAMLLMPLTIRHRCGMDNLFDLLHPLAPDLRDRVAALGPDLGTVCDDLRLPLSRPGEPPRFGAMRLVRLDAHRLIATITDVTQQVLAEQARQQAEERLRFAMDAALVGDWSLAPDSGRISGSPQHDLCVAGGAPLPQPWSVERLLERVLADDREALRQSLDQALREGGPWRCEFRVHWPDGSLHWLAMHGRPVPRHDAAPLLAGVVLETTHEREADALRQMAQDLRRENARLAETSQHKSRFVATMSHEMRSPLTSILGFAELLRGGAAEPGTAVHADCLDRIVGNGEHLLRLINDVLDLSKIEAGKLAFKPAPVALPALMREVCAAMAPQWQAKEQQVSLVLAEDLPTLHHDAARLRQVLYNLLSNAVKFTPRKGQVRLSASAPPGGGVLIEVSDTGIGIPAEHLPRLFTEFHQIDNGPGRAQEGTGLGLALSQRLVQAQGGRIGVTSTPGLGSQFSVHLPVRHPAATATPDTAAA